VVSGEGNVVYFSIHASILGTLIATLFEWGPRHLFDFWNRRCGFKSREGREV